MGDPGTFAAIGIALYAAHHVGDYWVQTDHQASHKGKPGADGRVACINHVSSYVLTQAAFVGLVVAFAGVRVSTLGFFLALFVSGVTHYAADRREHGIMFRLARLLPGKANFMLLGVPRDRVAIEFWEDCSDCEGRGTSHDESTGGKCWDCRGGGRIPVRVGDNPSLGTGTWALDQAWHIALGVFVPALIAVVL
jgi:hypothetical protein